MRQPAFRTPPPTPSPARRGGSGPLSLWGWSRLGSSFAFHLLIGKWPQLDVAANVAPEFVEAFRFEDQETEHDDSEQDVTDGSVAIGQKRQAGLQRGHKLAQANRQNR